jgi:hypothetical protein
LLLKKRVSKRCTLSESELLKIVARHLRRHYVCATCKIGGQLVVRHLTRETHGAKWDIVIVRYRKAHHLGKVTVKEPYRRLVKNYLDFHAYAQLTTKAKVITLELGLQKFEEYRKALKKMGIGTMNYSIPTNYPDGTTKYKR